MTAEKTLLKCAHCSKKFKYDSEKKRHEQSHFPQFQCKVCNKNFSFISALRRHEKQHERTGTVKCNECGREFRDEALLKRHTKYAHGGTYSCTKCDTIFNSEPALRTHMQTHKSESERRYQCSFEGCSKKFNFAHHLKHHELTHTNTKQHFCKICGKGFIQSHHLKAHLKTHSGDLSLYCVYPDCNKKFTTEFAKKRHVTKHHIKSDSGISSDSNSASDLSAPNVLDDDTNSPRADKILKLNQESPTSMNDKSAQSISEDLSIPSVYRQELIDDTNYNIDDDLSDCKLAFGRCIMHDKGEKCVCIQISKSNNVDYDFTPIEPESINMSKLNLNANDCKSSNCCGGYCGKILPNNDKTDIEYEYKADGAIKIKEFLNVDNVGLKNEAGNAKFVPYNSCKAVLGNCIVSADGTIDDGCLCAKMIIDEQATAEEIDDITPQPKLNLTFMNQYYKTVHDVSNNFNIEI